MSSEHLIYRVGFSQWIAAQGLRLPAQTRTLNLKPGVVPNPKLPKLVEDTALFVIRLLQRTSFAESQSLLVLG